MLIIDTVVRTSFTLPITFIILKRGQFKNMPKLMKLSFIGFIMTWFVFVAYTIMSYMTGIFVNLFITVASMFFLESHWLFIAHYLRVASLFKLLFSKHTENSLGHIKRKNSRLKKSIIIVSVLFLLNFVVYFIPDIPVAYFVSDWIVCSFLWFLALTNACMMFEIHKRQKPLEKIGIYKNKWIFVYYLCFWCGYSLSWTVCVIVETLAFAEHTFSIKSLMWVLMTCWIFQMIFFSCLDCLILYTFFRLSSFAEEEAIN